MFSRRWKQAVPIAPRASGSAQRSATPTSPPPAGCASRGRHIPACSMKCAGALWRRTRRRAQPCRNSARSRSRSCRRAERVQWQQRSSPRPPRGNSFTRNQTIPERGPPRSIHHAPVRRLAPPCRPQPTSDNQPHVPFPHRIGARIARLPSASATAISAPRQHYMTGIANAEIASPPLENFLSGPRPQLTTRGDHHVDGQSQQQSARDASTTCSARSATT